MHRELLQQLHATLDADMARIQRGPSSARKGESR